MTISTPELATTNEMEKAALRLLDHPIIRAAQQSAETELRESLKFVDPISISVLPTASREITFAAILHAMLDPEYPGILYTELLPRILNGRAIPGSRAIDDNPDTVYRFIPVDGQSRYIITGRLRSELPIVNEFSLLSDKYQTLQNLSVENLVGDADGSFVLEVDPHPADGRVNHIQTSSGATHFLIRDTLADWAREMPAQLAIRRLDPPTRPPLSEDALVERAARFVQTWFTWTIALHDEAVTRPANEFPQPSIRATRAMLVTQAYSIGRFAVEPGSALVLTVRPGAARYTSAAVTNLWGISNDPVKQQASLNSHQAARNADGSFTFIVSLEDPGVANWIDPGGIPQGFLFLRWAGIDPNDKGAEPLSVESATVPLTDLTWHVPQSMPRVAPADRRSQLITRAQTYERRWT